MNLGTSLAHTQNINTTFKFFLGELANKFYVVTHLKAWLSIGYPVS